MFWIVFKRVLLTLGKLNSFKLRAFPVAEATRKFDATDNYETVEGWDSSGG